MGQIAAWILSFFGLVGFITSMCVVVYLFWRRPKTEEPLPSGTYHVKVASVNQKTGAAVYEFEILDPDKK